MKKLTAHDIEVIKLSAGYDGDVTLDREDFEALIDAYKPDKGEHDGSVCDVCAESF